MRMYSATGQSRWPLVIAAIVVVAIVGGGIAWALTRAPSDTSKAAPSASPPASLVPTTGGGSGAGDDEDAAPPSGCLGGQERDAAMVLSAQKAAGHSTYGAVELATAFYRWFWEYPYPSDSEAAEVGSAIVSKSAPSSFRDLVKAIHNAGDDPTNGVVSPGVDFHLSTTNGLWMVSEKSTPDRVEVSVVAGYVIDGELSATKSNATGFVMQWEDGAWHVQTGLVVDKEKLTAGGTGFTGGC